MALIDDFLSRGYLPWELPPCFSSRSFAQFAAPGGVPTAQFQFRTAKVNTFSLARGNFRFRRQLGIVNPILFYRLAECIAGNWATIQTASQQSRFSKSYPVHIANPAAYDRAVRPFLLQRDMLPLRAANRAAARALVITDISDFYHSIYTHTIAWALHSKATAKQNRTMALLGNKLDRYIRDSQDGQTVGIPIGPDTSLVIAEIILAACDAELDRNLPGLRALRFIDDFEMAFSDLAKAETGLATIQSVLLSYELRLNPRKTMLRLDSVLFESEWVSELRNCRFRATTRAQANDLIRYFDRITEMVARFPQEHVVKYGLSRLASLTLQPANAFLFQSLLSQAVVAEPGAIREFCEAIVWLQQNGVAVAMAPLQETVEQLIRINAPLGTITSSAGHYGSS
jgi:hypothetical protein